MRRKFVPAITLTVLVAAAVAFAQSPSGVLEIASVSSAGVQGNGDSGTFSFLTPNFARGSITGDGRFVAFMSFADNLVPEDTNLVSDVFVRDRLTGTTARVSVASRGREADGDSGLTSRVVDISDDGRFVAFDSEATNLARGDDNANADVFVHDRLTGETELVSRSLGGDPATGDAPAISADGRFVAFLSSSQELVAGHPEFDFSRHVYVYDRQTQIIERVDVDSNEVLQSGGAVNVAIGADGRHIAFSTSTDLPPGPGDQRGVDVFVRNRVDGTTEGISTVGDTGVFEGQSFLSSITPDGRFVGFTSQDPTFGETDTNGSTSDAFVFDRQTGTVQIVSRDSAGVQGTDSSESPFVSADGTSVVFSSRAPDLVGDDTNQAYDVFRRDLVLGTTERLAADDGTVGSAVMGSDMTPDGLVITIITRADLVPGDAGIAMDVYVLDRRPAADLAVTKTDSPDPAVVRTPLTYTVTVQNLGPGSAGQVTLTDQLPADAVFESAAATQGTCARDGKGGRDGVLTCDLGTINAFDSATVTIVVTPSDDVTLTNTATVRANAPDPDTANNTATATTTVSR